MYMVFSRGEAGQRPVPTLQLYEKEKKKIQGCAKSFLAEMQHAHWPPGISGLRQLSVEKKHARWSWELQYQPCTQTSCISSRRSLTNLNSQTTRSSSPSTISEYICGGIHGSNFGPVSYIRNCKTRMVASYPWSWGTAYEDDEELYPKLFKQNELFIIQDEWIPWVRRG